MKHIIFFSVFYIINVSSYSQYNTTIKDKDIYTVLLKSLKIDEIKDSIITVRLNAITSPLKSKKSFKNSNIRFMRDSDLYKNTIYDYVDFNLIQVSPNIAYIKYIKRSKALAIHLVFHKKITSGWEIVDKNIWSEMKFKFDDFLYDSIKEELILDDKW